jgi:hypothetical protein
MNLHIASPCHVGWEQMTGNERVRLCDSCQLNVYNFSEMTRAEIDSLIRKTEGRLCGRIYKREDGTVITRDCPVGLRAVRLKVTKFAGAVFATILAACSISFSQTKKDPSQESPGYKITLTTRDPVSAGTFTGTVMDAKGAVIPRARVSLESSGNRITVADDTGRFSFKGLTDGQYTLRVSAEGFMTFTVTGIEIKASEGYSTEVTLSVRATTLGMLNTEAPLESNDIPMIEDPSLLKMQQVTELPILRGRIPTLGLISLPITPKKKVKEPKLQKHPAKN